MNVTEEVRKGLAEQGIEYDDTQMEKLQVYHDLLLEWNKIMDLTNVPEEEMAVRHYLDSLYVLKEEKLFFGNAHLIDVGTGAGFPGLPLAILRPDIKVTLLDAQQKRCNFLGEVVKRLALDNVEVLHMRAEDAAKDKRFREQYDIATARAVAALNVLAEYLLPFVRVGGAALCWKGPALKEELETAKIACPLLGGSVGRTLRLPLAGREDYVQEIEKIKKTLPQYPRKSGTPSKQPLGENKK